MIEITLIQRGENSLFRIEFYESFTKGLSPIYPNEHLCAAIAESGDARSTLVLQEHIDSPMDFGDEHFVYELDVTAANVLALYSTDLEWSKEAADVSNEFRPDAAQLEKTRLAVVDRIELEHEQLHLEFERMKSKLSASHNPPGSTSESEPQKKWWMFWK